jgi:lipopolysaccharide/colanic/teichoic acid biosynthesis glycosyltransferase
MKNLNFSKSYLPLKRLFDFLFAGFIFFSLFPVFLLVSLLIFLRMGFPIFFIQPRPGKDGKVFPLLKFRTMSQVADSSGQLLSDQVRLTKLGRLLRKLSLDELPQLINVLRGEMSLVGPRPLLVEYLPLYSIDQARRHDVLPGITGWAQINGRNTLSWDEKFKLDVWYVDNQSFFLDLKILFLTLKKVLIREGISANGEATMTKFTGN